MLHEFGSGNLMEILLKFYEISTPKSLGLKDLNEKDSGGTKQADARNSCFMHVLHLANFQKLHWGRRGRST